MTDIDAARRTVVRAIANRRDRITASGLDDRHTADIIYVLDRISVSSGHNDITVTCAAHKFSPRQRHVATAALHHALDVVDGTVEEINDLTVRLRPTANR